MPLPPTPLPPRRRRRLPPPARPRRSRPGRKCLVLPRSSRFATPPETRRTAVRTASTRGKDAAKRPWRRTFCRVRRRNWSSSSSSRRAVPSRSSSARCWWTTWTAVVSSERRRAPCPYPEPSPRVETLSWLKGIKNFSTTVPRPGSRGPGPITPLRRDLFFMFKKRERIDAPKSLPEASPPGRGQGVPAWIRGSGPSSCSRPRWLLAYLLASRFGPDAELEDVAWRVSLDLILWTL